MLEILHEILYVVAEYGIVAFEFIGVILLFWAGIMGIKEYMKKDGHPGWKLGKGTAVALQFLLCGEILKLIVMHELSDLITVGTCIGLHVILTLLVAYENKHHSIGHMKEHMGEKEH